MGNCTHRQDVDEATKNSGKSLAVLTFAGPNAFEMLAEDTMQPTFADPIFFSQKTQNSISYSV